MGLYCEFHHRPDNDSARIDPEFRSPPSIGAVPRLRLKNLNNRLHEEVMDAGLSPTEFQAGTFPERYRDRITNAVYDESSVEFIVDQ